MQPFCVQGFFMIRQEAKKSTHENALYKWKIAVSIRQRLSKHFSDSALLRMYRDFWQFAKKLKRKIPSRLRWAKKKTRHNWLYIRKSAVCSRSQGVSLWASWKVYRPTNLQKSPVHMQKSPIITPKEPYQCAKDPCPYAKESYSYTKEPCFAKESYGWDKKPYPYIKEPCLYAKDSCEWAKEPYLYTKDPYPYAKDTQKSEALTNGEFVSHLSYTCKKEPYHDLTDKSWCTKQDPRKTRHAPDNGRAASSHGKGQRQRHVRCHCLDTTMQQVQALWNLTWVGGNLGSYVAIFAVPVPCTQHRADPNNIARSGTARGDAMRTHASKRSMRPPTHTRLASASVDSNSNSEALVDGARSEIFCVTRRCDLIHHIHTHSNIQIALCLIFLNEPSCSTSQRSRGQAFPHLP